MNTCACCPRWDRSRQPASGSRNVEVMSDKENQVAEWRVAGSQDLAELSGTLVRLQFDIVDAPAPPGTNRAAVPSAGHPVSLYALEAFPGALLDFVPGVNLFPA